MAGRERLIGTDEIVVSKTDPQGRIRYCNDVFLRVSGFSERELIGKPHNIIRHPKMPRVVFNLMWRTICAGNEFFGYVLNRCKGDDYYWVFAHVTPDLDRHGAVAGYHSNRRSVDRSAISAIAPLYDHLCAEEQRHKDPKAALAAADATLQSMLASSGKSYEQFVLGL